MTEAGSFRRYLLGELDESDMEAFEKELLLSDEQFQELSIEEDELIDDYWAGTLSQREEQAYREHFLVTPERRHRHRLGEALRAHVSAAAARDAPAPPEPVPHKAFGRMWLRLAAAAAVVALAVTMVLWMRHQPPMRLEQTARHGRGSTVAFFLTTGNLRSLPTESQQTIAVPAEADYVDLQLDLPDDAAGEHEVTLENARTNTVLAEGRLASQTIEGQRVIVASVPSALLTPGDYRVILRVPAAEGERANQRTYAFRVAGR